MRASCPLRFGRGRMVSVASAPLVDVPAGIMARETAAGLTLANHLGKTLYFADPKTQDDCTGECARSWIPLSAPALVDASKLSKQWSVSIRKDGQRQWAFEGKPLHTYAHDAAANGEQFYGDTASRSRNGSHPAASRRRSQSKAGWTGSEVCSPRTAGLSVHRFTTPRQSRRSGSGAPSSTRPTGSFRAPSRDCGRLLRAAT